MKKYSFLLACLLCAFWTFAETVKLKDGTFISGSITSQTEYTLNVTTAYGPVVLNQREVEAILPDKHRIHLKGGTELVGIIVDLDEFNLKLQTDDGTVNIDMPQIVSIEAYDYEQGDAAQKTIAARQAQQEAQAVALAATAAAAGTQTALSGSETATATSAAGGLSFDADIEKVFDTKKPEIVNGQVQTIKEVSAADLRAQRAATMSDEEAFLKGISPQEREAAIAQTAEAARTGKLEKIKQSEAKKASRPKENATNKMFAISVGAQTNDLKLDNSEQKGFAGTDPYDVGGTSVRVEAEFLWRIKDSNFWLGPSLAVANIAKNSFTDLDPAIDPAYTDDPDVSTSGQMFDLMLKGTYYFNPKDLFTVYATASAGYRMLTLNYHGVIEGDNINSNAIVGAAGIGVQRYFDDVLIALEVRELFSAYSGKFKDSSVANTVASISFNWKF